jgi:hypothetical protein
MTNLIDAAPRPSEPTGGHPRIDGAPPSRFGFWSLLSWGRRVALAGGIAYLLTFVFSIPTLGMKAPLDDPSFVLGVGSSTSVVWAGLFDVLTGFAGIATAVALYPVIRRQSRRCSLGFLASRTLEAALLTVGALSLMSIVTLRLDGTGTPDTLVSIAHALLAFHDWAFLFGPGVMSPINALLLGTVMYRSGLVPRWIPALGLIGAPLGLASAAATLFGVWEQVSGPATLAMAPVAIWELSLGIYLTFKGFKPSPGTDEIVPSDACAVAA